MLDGRKLPLGTDSAAESRVASIKVTPWAAARLPMSVEALEFSTVWLAERLGARRRWKLNLEARRWRSLGSTNLEGRIVLRFGRATPIPWVMLTVLAHEVGHNLDLRHPLLSRIDRLTPLGEALNSSLWAKAAEDSTPELAVALRDAGLADVREAEEDGRAELVRNWAQFADHILSDLPDPFSITELQRAVLVLPEALAVLRVDLEDDDHVLQALAEHRHMPEAARRRYVELLDRILLTVSDASIATSAAPPAGAFVRSSRSYAPGMVTVPGRSKDRPGRVPVLYEWGLRFEWIEALEVLDPTPEFGGSPLAAAKLGPGCAVGCPTPIFAFEGGTCEFHLTEAVVTSRSGDAVYVRRAGDRRPTPVPRTLLQEIEG